MEQAPPPPSELDTYLFDERTLRECHWHLTHDDAGNDEGHLATPGSRYCATSADCAWWAVAAGVAYLVANGSSDDPDILLDWLMGLAVNDNEQVLGIVQESWNEIPSDLYDQLDWVRAALER